MKKGSIIIMSAPSGAGKTTICNELLKRYKNIRYSISVTTRQPRGSELDGNDYFFIDEKTFKKKIKENAFAEWAIVHGNYYGTLKSTINDITGAGGHVLLDIDVQGAEKIMANYPDAISVFITVPDMAELERRLRNRGTDSEEVIQRRLEQARTELTYKDKYGYIAVNDNLDDAINKIITYLLSCIELEER